MGQQLASVLNNLIDEMVDDETSRADIIEQMAEAAGIDADTVNQILNEEINCPPVERLRGFARVLDTSAGQLQDAAEEDGCDYGDDDRSGPAIERRFYTAELRAVEIDGETRVVGHAAVFNQISEDLGGFQEMVMPGAFADALSEDVRAVFNHDPNMILGRTISETLRLSEDGVGLRYEISPPDTQYARDLLVSVERGDVDQSSFGFRAIEESWRHPDESNPLPTRILHKVRLFDVGPVTFPAYPTTSVQVRSKARQIIERCNSCGGATREDGRTVGRLAVMRRRLELAEKM